MKRIIPLLLPLLLILNCSTWYQLTKKESRYYTEEEKLILEATTAAVDFRYGFDPSLELDYVYKAGTFSEKELTDKNKK
ncbi:MAG TPA: hypothetical protein PK986_02640, partial [Spirochaetota bacterium]|nr:hypothetical protein [Spirochaetota bacterium]